MDARSTTGGGTGVDRAQAPLAVSLGDPAGVGPEIIGKSWAVRGVRRLPSFMAVGDRRAIAQVWDGPIATVADADEAMAVFDRALPVLPARDAGDIVPGAPDIDGAHAAFDALELATRLVREGAARALVTGPVSKAQLYGIGFNHPGQTEFVADRCGVAEEDAVMMLAGPSLRVVPVTTHVPIAEVARLLTIDLIVSESGMARSRPPSCARSPGRTTPSRSSRSNVAANGSSMRPTGICPSRGHPAMSAACFACFPPPAVSRSAAPTAGAPFE